MLYPQQKAESKYAELLTGGIYVKSFDSLECLVMLHPKSNFKAKLLNKAFGIANSVELFQNSIDVTTTWYQKLMWSSNLFLKKPCRNLNFMVT